MDSQEESLRDEVKRLKIENEKLRKAAEVCIDLVGKINRLSVSRDKFREEFRNVCAQAESMADKLDWYFMHWGTNDNFLKAKGCLISRNALLAWYEFKHKYQKAISREQDVSRYNKKERSGHTAMERP